MSPQTRKTWLRHRDRGGGGREWFWCGRKQQGESLVNGARYGDGEREYADEVEDEEAYERFRSGLRRYDAGAGPGVGTAGVGTV